MSKRLQYLPRLDALRAIAAFMVLFSHYLSDVKHPVFFYGRNGVQIFFVISGFLITTILLGQKNLTGISKPKVIFNFMAKRALRLFPAYYLLIGSLFIISLLTGMWICQKGDGWYYFTYMQNFLFASKGMQSSLLNHTWSLAVEEQFYLLWPLLIVLLPGRLVLPVITSVFLLGIGSRVYLVDVLHLNEKAKTLTIVNFDTLGAGALLAYFTFYRKEQVIRFLDRFADLIFLAGLLASGTLTYLKKDDPFFMPLALTLMSVGLVYICAFKTNSILRPVMDMKWLQQLGKMSYGIYLFHKPVPFFIDRVLDRTGIHVLDGAVPKIAIYTTATLIIASLSWRFFERPILQLKNRFDL